MKRIWDKENKYLGGLVKEFDHWVWEVSYRQHTLGCFILFAKRSVERISELRPKELISLGGVMREVEDALSKIKVFRPDRFNYWQMGNGLPHLHFHGFPRYEKPRYFDGKKWIDKTWGTVPMWLRKDVSRSLVEKIKEEIVFHL